MFFIKRMILVFIFFGIIWGIFFLVIYCVICFICGRDLLVFIFVFCILGVVVFYVGLFVFFLFGSINNRELFFNNFKIVRNYWMFVVMGLI